MLLFYSSPWLRRGKVRFVIIISTAPNPSSSEEGNRSGYNCIFQIMLNHLKQLIHQKDYEKIEKVVRRDMIVVFGGIIFYIVLLLAPAFLYLMFQNYLPLVFGNFVLYPLFVLGLMAYYLSVWLFMFVAFLNYYLDCWIITNDRLMNIDQQGIFSRTISELDLYKIQDATSEVKGMLASLFGYGTIYIQTAGEVERFRLQQVPNPHELRKVIMDLAEEDRKYHNQNVTK
jgi:uncharacterized membrane protein YdbT with pleckstrin-like domain